MEKKKIYRGCIYIVGLLILACGLVMNTKAGLGVSPIISVAYSISEITGLNFGDMTLIWYSVLVLTEIVIHMNIVEKGKRKSVIVKDVLQIALSLVFTRFVNLFSSTLPSAEQLAPGSIAVKIALLILALVLTGCGAAMSLDVRIIPNPGDGIVQAIGDLIGKSVGFTKNCVDAGCVAITLIISLSIAHHVIGIGIGTLVSVIVVGRVVAIFNHFFLKKIQELNQA